jgi:2-C-methyl-D-erythritol 2,4-cyclodiphosphate synthase
VIRVGQGTDAHRFSEDPARPLVLGGVAVPGSRGLSGHSDADVATHALCDAILGAAGLGDLGRHFPSDDPTYEGASSMDLLARCCAMARGEGLVVGNADVTIVAEVPRLSELVGSMAGALSAVVAAPVSVKATSTDGLGAIGREEGIAASAVVLLEDRSAP